MEIITKPRGTQDVLPKDTYKWQYIEDKIRNVCRKFGYLETRFPTFEHTELFSRGVGDTTDIVQKEMYTFNDKAGRSITLRPEGTASVVRQLVESGAYGGAMPLKMYYVNIPCFRYEKPQTGRFREFHQFGVECFGAGAAAADVEVISLGKAVIDELNIRNVKLMINSIGCPECRPKFSKALHDYFAKEKDLCETCGERLAKNPMRILDCKSPVCSKIAKGAPTILEFLCDNCKSHFEEVKEGLRLLGISFEIDSNIVRGLDYYTNTVFEFVTNEIGSQGAVCGGGRYNGLVEELSGYKLEGLGFAMGMERLLMVMQAQDADFGENFVPDIYFASVGGEAVVKCLELADKMRKLGISGSHDIVGRSLKAQMKYADKIGAKFTAVVGDSEIENNRLTLKNMSTGETFEVDFEEIVNTIRGALNG